MYKSDLLVHAITRLFKHNLPLIFLSLIAVFICFANYTPGTILSGWDTLHPEFNFGLAIKRDIFGVFRTYQGLGAVSAHSAMADLPRILLLAVFDIFLPMNFLRYSYIFLTLILGSIGVYLFLYKHILKHKTSSFLGGLFYLLNLGTLQQFAVPFEMFVTQYAALPWAFLFATDYFVGTKRNSLLFFTITTILAAPMAFAATLWYIYFISFVLYLSALAFSRILHLRGVTSSHLGGGRMDSSEVNGKVIHLFKKASTLILLTLLLNSFWILPNIYYVFNHASEVPHANINRLFSEQAFLYNKQFGNIKDIVILKSFLFDWTVYAGNNHFTQLLSPWVQHLKQPFVGPLGYLFAGISLAGIIYSIFRKNKILIAFLPLLFLSLFFLFNDNPPTSPLFSFLQERFGFFKEAYRFPQDKVRGIYTFVFAIYFAAGQLAIARFVSNNIKRQGGVARLEGSRQRAVRSVPPLAERLERALAGGKAGQDPSPTKPQLAQALIFTLALFYFMFPAFKGELISPYMRTKIPDYYFEMFKWFDKQPEGGRVANLPIHSFWGWDYYHWQNNDLPSFQGAGFIWFGIKQPVLARDFDRWIPYNEQYYREMSYAIYSQNPEALKIVLEKYNIKYILLDKNIIAPPNPPKALLYEETQELLDKQDYIQKTKEFGSNLIVYELKTNKSNGYYLIQNPFSINETSEVLYEDFIYKDYGDYIIKQDGVFYPFRTLTDNQNKILPNILKLTQEGVVIDLDKCHSELVSESNASRVEMPKRVRHDNKCASTFPSYFDTQESIPSDLVVEKNQNQLSIIFYPRFPTLEDTVWYPPITLTASIPDSENIILSVNKKDNFILDRSLSNMPLSLGAVYLSAKSDNTITIYGGAPDQEIFPNLKIINYYIEPCEGSDDLAVFGAGPVGFNSFYIVGKESLLCMTVPLSYLLPKDPNYPQTLLDIEFDYSSSLPSKFCVSRISNGACQNYRSSNLFGIEEKDIKELGLQFRLDTEKSDQIEKALYENLALKLTYPFFSTSFSTPSSLPNLPYHPYSLNLLIPFSGDPQLSAKITEFPNTNAVCPNQPIGNSSIIKKEILKDPANPNTDDFIRYSSEEGTACDYFPYHNLSQNQAYLIAVTSRNINGLPMNICVANQVSKHCEIYASLSKSSDFTTDFFLLPFFIKNESGFDVNIRNHGIKKTPAVNDLKSIEIIPFPYKWLSQITTGTMKQFNNETMNDVLVLPYSFEKGWKAYRIKNHESRIMNWIQTTFPFLFGEELKDHVLVNNWANGWTLGSQSSNRKTQNYLAEQDLASPDNSNLKTGQTETYKTIEQFNNDNNSTIVFLFLPQYLQYLGFVLLAGTIICLGISYRK